MNDPHSEENPNTHSVSGNGAPPPPKKTAGDLPDDSSGAPHIDIPDPVLVRDLAIALKQKPYKIIGDLINMGVFAVLSQKVGFETAAKVARKYGFHARRTS